jgi:hypothetical protein
MVDLFAIPSDLNLRVPFRRRNLGVINFPSLRTQTTQYIRRQEVRLDLLPYFGCASCQSRPMLLGAVRLLRFSVLEGFWPQLKLELDQLAMRLEEADALIQMAAEESKVGRRLDAIPGIGPLTATALIAAIGNGAAFRKDRDFAAWVGLVPREHSTGFKKKLLATSKHGNCYLRTLFCNVHALCCNSERSSLPA